MKWNYIDYKKTKSDVYFCSPLRFLNFLNAYLAYAISDLFLSYAPHVKMTALCYTLQFTT